MKVEFLIDIVPRDVPAALAMAAAGAADGLDCAVTASFIADGDGRWTLTGSRTCAADVLVTPAYNAARTLETLARARLAGARLVHFPSEQFFSRLFDSEKLNTRCAAAYRRQVDAVLVWGEYYARRLVEDVGFPRERIYEVGSPRVGGEPSPGRADGPTRVLFISDFTLADLQSPGQRRRFGRSYGARVTPEAVARLDAERRYLIDTAGRLAQRDGFEVRLRPHPGERLDLYRAACGNGGPQYADPSRPFTDDVRWADAVIGYTSTAIFEVIAAGRPFLSLRRDPSPPAIVYREGLESLYRIGTAEELLALLADPAALEAARQAIAAEAAYYIGNINGAYDPARALYDALPHLCGHASRPPATAGDRLAALWGGVRSAGKYAALRAFTSYPWRRLGLWQPPVVQRRRLPAHCLTRAVTEDYRRRLAASGPDHAPAAEAVTWALGPWCWRPHAAGTTSE